MSMGETPTPSSVSWETELTSMPERPGLTSSLPEEQRVARPLRLTVALTCCGLAALFVGAALLVAALKLDEIKDHLVQTLPADLAKEYTSDDTHMAAGVLLVALTIVSVVCTFILLASLFTVAIRRSAGSRAAHLIFSVFMFGVLIVTALVRELDAIDLVLFGGAILCLLLTNMLVLTPRVSLWLHQSEERPRISLVRH